MYRCLIVDSSLLRSSQMLVGDMCLAAMAARHISPTNTKKASRRCDENTCQMTLGSITY